MNEFRFLEVAVSDLATASMVADQIASRNVFADYRRGIAAHTLRRQDADLALFAAYLTDAGVSNLGDFRIHADAWSDVSGGIVKGFREWMLNKGYAIGSINVRLSTIKQYASLAFDAHELTEEQLLSIKQVKLLRYKNGINIDRQRVKTRVGTKKKDTVLISPDMAARLKSRPDTPQGRRDAVLICLLLDHGLRCSEIALLQVAHFDLQAALLKFYRPKVYKAQTHKLTADTLRALKSYLERDKPTEALLLASRKDGTLTEGSMSTRAITMRVCVIGESLGLPGLSAHDCRHYWASHAARSGTDVKTLQTAGGWNSPIMPMRYISEAEIANEGVKLS